MLKSTKMQFELYTQLYSPHIFTHLFTVDDSFPVLEMVTVVLFVADIAHDQPSLLHAAHEVTPTVCTAADH